MFSMDIGVDLGTASVLVYIKGRGVVLKEPSVVAYDRDTNEIREIGEEARKMIGRTPGNIVAIRPLRQGVISDYDITEKMLKYFLRKAMGKKQIEKMNELEALFYEGGEKNGHDNIRRNVRICVSPDFVFVPFYGLSSLCKTARRFSQSSPFPGFGTMTVAAARFFSSGN
jgi:hypothetical protein